MGETHSILYSLHSNGYSEYSRQWADAWAKGLAFLSDKEAQQKLLEELGEVLEIRNGLQAKSLADVKGKTGAMYYGAFLDESQETRDYLCRNFDRVFTDLCRAFGGARRFLTGGQISDLKRKGLPDPLAKELDAIKGIAGIPEAERLDEEFAEALHGELTRRGFISGPYGAFAYHLGPITPWRQKRPAEGLKWIGTDASFAYFAWLFTEHTQREVKGLHSVREKALCCAFGIDDKQRINAIKPCIADIKKVRKPRTSTEMEAAFAAALAASTPKKQ